MSIAFVGVGDMFAHPDIRRQDHIPVVAVNTIGEMGAGQALAYRRWDPDGCAHYASLCDDGLIQLGEVWLGGGDQGHALFFPTMEQPGSRSNLIDIERAVDDWAHTLTNSAGFYGYAWHVPQIGCGIGRLAWPDVASILVERLSGIDGHAFLLYGPDPTEVLS